MKNFIDDCRLLENIAQGDSKSFESLLGKYKDLVYGFCFKMTGDKSMAEDLSQETWLKVVQNAHSFYPKYNSDSQPVAKVSSWIVKIARNLALNEIKKKKWELSDESYIQGLEDPDKDIESLLIGIQNKNDINKAIQSLSEQSRVVLVMWMSDEVSHSQIAEELSISVANVKVVLFRAKKELQNLLGVKS